jgi:hypothetical protein
MAGTGGRSPCSSQDSSGSGVVSARVAGVLVPRLFAP